MLVETPRPDVGRYWSCLSSYVDCSCGVVVSMIGASPETSTTSFAAPGDSVTLAVPVVFKKHFDLDGRGPESCSP